MAIMDLKLVQYLARVDHDPLFLVLLDLPKAYNTVERDRLIQNLEVYDTGPCMCRLLENVLAHQQVVTIQNGYQVTASLST